MQKKFPLFLGILLVVGATAGGAYLYWGPQQNPDPNHTHADFAVWVGGKHLDFSGDRYMSGSSTDPTSHPEEGLQKYLHLHDGIGHVIHRHKPGLMLGDFFTSIGLPMSGECLTLDAYQYAQLDASWKKDFAVQPALCPTGKFHWQMYVNGKEVPFDPAYAFADNDQILLTYGAGDMHDDELQQLTDDACRYSRTCPWKGAPPAENCIADPAVPCTL